VHLANGQPVGKIAALAEDGVKGLWLAGDGWGIVRFAGGKVLSLVELAPGASSPTVVDHRGGVWFKSGTDLIRIETDNRQAMRMTERMAGARPQVLCPTHDGGLWVASQDRVRKLREGVWQADFTLYQETGETGRRIVTALLEDRDGGLWIGTYGGGVFYMADASPPKRVATQGALSQNIITCFCEDSEGRSGWGPTVEACIE